MVKGGRERGGVGREGGREVRWNDADRIERNKEVARGRLKNERIK